MEDELEPKELDDTAEEDLDEIDDDLILGKKKGKKAGAEDDSLDALADEEEETLPEDSFDDVDLW